MQSLQEPGPIKSDHPRILPPQRCQQPFQSSGNKPVLTEMTWWRHCYHRGNWANVRAAGSERMASMARRHAARQGHALILLFPG